MGFINDEQDIAALASQVVEGGAKLRQETGKTESGYDLESEQDFVVEGGDAEMWVGQVDQGIKVAVEGLCKGTNGSGFAGTNVSGNERGEMILEGEGEAALDLAVAVRGKKILGGDGFGKGCL